MSDIASEQELEESLRKLHAQGEYAELCRAADKALDHLSATNRIRHFENPATTYQYMIALSRLGKFEEAIALRWSAMAGWDDFTPERQGDWYRDGHALFFLSKGNCAAAKGALREAMKLHEYGNPKYLLDELVLALVAVVQNRPASALKNIRAVIGTIERVEQERRQEFASVERLASWWLLLLKYAVGQANDVSNLAAWVATHDVSERRQKQALKLSSLSGRRRARSARKLIDKEIKTY